MPVFIDIVVTLAVIASNYFFALQTDAYLSFFDLLRKKIKPYSQTDFSDFWIVFALVFLSVFIFVLFAAPLGIARSKIFYFLGLFSLVVFARHVASYRSLALSKPASTLFLVSSIALLIFLTKLYSLDFLSVAQTTWFEGILASDNVLPFLLLKNLLLTNQTIITPLLETWLTSDRPPLMTAMALPYLAWISLVIPFLPIGINPEEILLPIFFIVGVNLNCLALCGTLKLASELKLSANRSLLLLLLLSTPFVVVNLAYTWPKMLAAYFCLLAVIYHLRKRSIVVALCCILAILCHGSSVYFCIPIALLQVVNIRTHLTWLPCYALILAQWELYKIILDPPGDRLIKYHIAGVRDLTEVSAFKVIYDAYTSLSMQSFVNNKLNNVLHLFPGNKIDFGWAQFFHLLPALAVPLIFFCVRLIFGRKVWIHDKNAHVLVSIIAGSLALNVTLQFGGDHSVSSLPHLPYATALTIFLLLSRDLSGVFTNVLFCAVSLINLVVSTNRFTLTNNIANNSALNEFAITVLACVTIYWIWSSNRKPSTRRSVLAL